MRRANGTGSVYKLSGNRHNPYIAVVDLGYDDTGRRIRKRIGSFRTAREGQKALEMYLVNPRQANQTRVTVGDVWEAAKHARETKGAIARALLSAWKNHVSKLSKMPIANIKTMHLQDVINTAPASLHPQIKTVFRMIFRMAISNDLTEKDYSQFVTIATPAKSEKHTALTTAEMRTLWSTSENEHVQIALIQIYTGMRQNELAKMRIADVHIAEQYMIGGSKTDAGRNRVIPIADCILPFVKHFYNISHFMKSELLITPDTKRGIRRSKNTANIAGVWSLQLPIKGHTSHDARHTFITLSDNYGMPEKVQQVIAGHKAANVTKDIYTHKAIIQLIAAVNTLPHGTDMFVSPDEQTAHRTAK